MKELKNISVNIAGGEHLKYIDDINNAIDIASKQRGTGIARRTYEYLAEKIERGKAIIALEKEQFAGFCYIESWENKGFVANSGLIVVEKYRGVGLAKAIKKKAFELSRERYPNSKIFGLTTGLAVMKINHELGYRPVTFSELTNDNAFWAGCNDCINHDILERTDRTKCLCTGMLYNPEWEKPTYTNGNGIRKRSLLKIIKKMKPGNGKNKKKKLLSIKKKQLKSNDLNKTISTD
ncbi:MAG: GNAT family N-acetyltransferase [Bacteroidota bacterium]